MVSFPTGRFTRPQLLHAGDELASPVFSLQFTQVPVRGRGPVWDEPEVSGDVLESHSGVHSSLAPIKRSCQEEEKINLFKGRVIDKKELYSTPRVVSKLSGPSLSWGQMCFNLQLE